MMEEPKITCSKCGQPKTSDDFSRRSGSSKYSKNRWCKTCCSEAVKKVYRESLDYRQSHKLAQRRRSLENLRFILEYLTEHPCVDCGESDLLVLHFDHEKLEDKYMPVTSMLLLSRQRIQDEIARCFVRCANCHARRTAEQFNTTRFKLVQEIKAKGMVPSKAPRPYKRSI